MTRALEVRGLTVAFGGEPVVHDVSFALAPGECVAIVGESGSGKSVTTRAILGLAGRGARVEAERLELAGLDLLRLSPRDWRRVRGARIGLVLQDALVSLDPLRTIGREVGDAFRLHSRRSAGERWRAAVGALERAGMPDAATRARQLPGTLSGGLRQRALIASAIALDPPFLIADEPTTALDATVQRRVLDELARLKAAGTGILLVSHDLGVVAGLADRVLVLRRGRVVEQGDARTVLERPASDAARELLAAIPAGRPRGERLLAPADHLGSGPASPDGGAAPAPAPTAGAEPPFSPSAPVVLELRGVHRSYTTPAGPLAAVDGVDLVLHAGETLGVVGESGSGKTTLARLALGLERADAGAVTLFGEAWGGLPERERRSRRRRLGLVSQDTSSSFDPRWTVARTLADALPGGLGRAGRDAAVDRLLADVGLDSELARRSPATLSGGQRQRVAIARALATEPSVLVLDEPVSALDVTVQARVLDLLDELQRRRGLAYLFITHDLEVIAHASDRILVMRAGRVVEEGSTARVLAAPTHPYTVQLIADAPRAAFRAAG